MSVKTRNQIADELMQDCPDESVTDHQIIANAIRAGKSVDEILDMPETNNWPDTYSWIKSNLD